MLLQQVRKEYEDMRKKRLDEFMAGFNVISLKLKEMYQMITLGGDAELELVDSLDPFSEVILLMILYDNVMFFDHNDTDCILTQITEALRTLL